MNNHITISRPVFGMLLLSLTVIMLFSCGKYEGSVSSNQLPSVEFATTPPDSSIFNYAPIVSWFGTDPDGFVERYSYADIVDPSALLNPQAYVTQIPQDAWRTTSATSDTIILLTSSGDTTQHIFYLKCTDNRGGESSVIYRRFSRTNQPPDPPQIRNPFNDSWSSNTELTDTLYSIDSPTNLWPGINFNWKATKSGVSAGQAVPLTYKYYLIKAPSDTIRRYMSQSWTTTKTITLSGLETGSYRFEIYSRDDGLTLSRVPGVVYFTVIKPTFDKSLLIYMEGTNNRTSNGRRGILNIDSAKAYYQSMLRSIQLQYPQLAYLNYNTNDNSDVTFWIHTGVNKDSVPSTLQLSHYRVVIWMQDVYNAPSPIGKQYHGYRLKRFNDYLQVGGRMMVSGRLFALNMLPAAVAADTAYPSYFAQRPQFFQYFGNSLVLDTAVTNRYFWPGGAECIGTNKQFVPMTNVPGDTSRLRRGMIVPYDDSSRFMGIPGIDYLQSNGARTVFTFVSNTSDTNFYPPHISGEDSRVIGAQPVVINGNTVTYPPTPTNCLIQIQKSGDLQQIYSVVNLSKLNLGANSNGRGEVRSITGSYAFITYQYGEPWTDADTLSVNYLYRATSPRNGRPVCTAYEQTQVVGNTTVSVLLTRTVFATFPWYFMDQTVAPENFGRLLNWLLGPPNLSLY